MTGRQQHFPRVVVHSGGELSGYVSGASALGPSALLYVHGFGSVRTGEKADALEAMCAARSWTFAAFEFRGHGASSGTLLDLRGDTLLNDLDAIWSHLAGQGVRRLFPVGSSMGGWATAWFTLRRAEVVPAAAFIAPAFEFVLGRWAQLSEAERLAFQQTRRLTVMNYGRDREEAIDFALVEQAARYPTDDLARALDEAGVDLS